MANPSSDVNDRKPVTADDSNKAQAGFKVLSLLPFTIQETGVVTRDVPSVTWDHFYGQQWTFREAPHGALIVSGDGVQANIYAPGVWLKVVGISPNSTVLGVQS